MAKLSEKPAVVSAIDYARGRWSALLRFCEDGRMEIDNNLPNVRRRGSPSGGSLSASRTCPHR
jgi:Transposase IS66 family